MFNIIKKIIAPIVGLISIGAYIINIALNVTLLLLTALIRVIIPWQPWRKFWYKRMHELPILWIAVNAFIFKLTSGARVTAHLPEGLNPKGSYLLFANHQAWADVLIISQALNRKAPSLKFFLKKELKYVPFVGLACQLLDFPFMARHSREALRKNPKLRDQDLLTTKKACEKFKEIPLTLSTFSEGTRFTTEKHARTKSPFKHLLKPKAGGLAFSLEMLGDRFSGMLDVTVVYLSPQPTFWSVLTGQLGDVVVDVKLLPLEGALKGDYHHDSNYRKQFQKWINARWQTKDALIEHIKTQQG